MPRPGPRPYECIRRAWHSDAHQPLRGKLTQEILKVVTELHKAETRRKREWQEKLPTVVLRAEEILYSKAKSEAEYMDEKTFRERLDDAVDTMIRRTDASSQEGPYMQPCVEAALSLGCVSKSFPRGQRAGARHICANSKRPGSSSSATSPPNSAAFPGPSTPQDYSSQNAETSGGAILHPSQVKPPQCTSGGFAAPTEKDQFTDRVSFQGGATIGQHPEKPIADLHTPSSSADFFTPYPFVCSLPSTLPLSASLLSNSLPGSFRFQPTLTTDREMPFSGNLHFRSPIFADMIRQTPSPVAAGLRENGGSTFSSKLEKAAGTRRTRPVDEAKAVGDGDGSSGAVVAAEVEDLQLKLAPPGSFPTFASSSSEFSNSGSCITHTLTHKPEYSNIPRELSSDMDRGDTHLQSVPFPLASSILTEPGCRIAPNSGLKKQRLCNPPSPIVIRDRESSEECCDLQIGLSLQAQR